MLKIYHNILVHLRIFSNFKIKGLNDNNNHNFTNLFILLIHKNLKLNHNLRDDSNKILF